MVITRRAGGLDIHVGSTPKETVIPRNSTIQQQQKQPSREQVENWNRLLNLSEGKPLGFQLRLWPAGVQHIPSDS